MYDMSDAFTSAAEANARQILVKAVFNGTVELTGDNIIDMTVTEATNASAGLSMGAAISSKLVMTIKMPETPLLLNGGSVRPYVGLIGTDEYCPLGQFFITDAVSNDDFQTKVTITAYDGFSKTEKVYAPTISVPNTARAIMDDIATQCGFVLAPSTVFDDTGIGSFMLSPSAAKASAAASSASLWLDEGGTLIFSESPRLNETGTLLATDPNAASDSNFYEYTCREYIGHIAGLMGTNARFNRNGELEFVWYTATEYTVPRNLQYLGGLKRLTGADFTINSVTSGSSENIIVAGNGVGINFSNPFITQEIVDNIFSGVGGASYTPASLKWRGNPAIEAGDIIKVEDKTGMLKDVYIMEQTLKISGGMYSEIKCYGDSEAAMSFSTSPTSKKLQQVYTQLQDAIKSATELLNGNNGGVFEITDGNEDGINDGWIIHSADGQKFIKATVDGIGITTDGGATYQQAMTADGINATAITVGSLNAERIAVENYDEDDPTKLTDYIHFGEGTITLGKGGSAIILKLENDQIAFYNTAGTRLGRFTNNSFEIENLEDGQIRFQNFGFIPRASGNLSFTKLI